MAKQAIYDPNGNVVTFVETKSSFWDTVIGGGAKLVNDIKKAPKRRAARIAFEDHLLREEYAREQAIKDAKQAVKDAKKRSKLEEVYSEATA